MNGVDLVAKERQRQIKEEGWAPEHDDEHINGELARTAVCYASPCATFVVVKTPEGYYFVDTYPQTWYKEWDKRRRDDYGNIIENQVLPTEERIRNLVKAGALICAEIDRLQRLQKKNKSFTKLTAETCKTPTASC